MRVLRACCEGGLGIDVVERLEGHEVGQAKVLVERKADGAGEGELVLLEVVLRRRSGFAARSGSRPGRGERRGVGLVPASCAAMA